MATNIEEQIARKEKELEELKAEREQELLQKLKEARKRVADLEGEYARMTGKAVGKPRRKNTTAEERKSRILGTLSANPKGVSLTELQEGTGLSAVSIYEFVQEHPKEVRTTGERKSKRYFLK